MGDWIDRGVGDLAPLWPDDVLVDAIAAAHAAGARVTAHVFGTDALPGLIGAGIDCIEHGTGLTDDLIAEMARRGTALVPTLINVETFPGIADARHALSRVRRPHARAARRGGRRRPARRSRPGWPSTRAPTRAGRIAHGRIVDEVGGAARRGSPRRRRRGQLGGAGVAGPPVPARGPPADLVVYRDDPRADPSVLREPALVMRRGPSGPLGLITRGP